MIEVNLYFSDAQKIDLAIEALQMLPEPLRPVFFSEGERVLNKADRIADAPRFREFREDNLLGFFLMNKNCLYNFSIRKDDYCLLNVYPRKSRNLVICSHIFEFFEVLASANPAFGLAAEGGEYDHRNRLFTEIGETRVESWAGRDLRKYVPGLYWYTLFSSEILSKHQVDISRISAGDVCLRHVSLTESISLIQYFEHSDEWESHAGLLDDLCESTKGIFSIRALKEKVRNVSSSDELTSLTHEWR